MLLLIDIGNTHTHLGLANERRVLRHADVLTSAWGIDTAKASLRRFVGQSRVHGAALCSVVPRCSPVMCQAIARLWNMRCLELTSKNVTGLGIDYPKPKTIGPDRLANAIAAKHEFGAPVVVVDFGTAVTF